MGLRWESRQDKIYQTLVDEKIPCICLTLCSDPKISHDAKLESVSEGSPYFHMAGAENHPVTRCPHSAGLGNLIAIDSETGQELGITGFEFFKEFVDNRVKPFASNPAICTPTP